MKLELTKAAIADAGTGFSRTLNKSFFFLNQQNC